VRTLKELHGGVEVAGRGPCTAERIARQVDAALSQLPATHVAALVANTCEQQSLETISRRLGLPIDLVRTYCSQARALVRIAPWNS
jgi:DNA-directed RNA polymerase specialized sigma24 family protein